MRPEIITSALAVWIWSLLPSSVQVSIAGNAAGPVEVSGTILTAPMDTSKALEQVELALRLQMDSAMSLLLDGPLTIGESSAAASIDGTITIAGAITPVHWTASVTCHRDINAQELLHLIARGESSAGPVVIDTWFVRSSPPAAFVPFCSSDE